MVPQRGGHVHDRAVASMNAAAKIDVSRAREPAVTAHQTPAANGLTYRDAGVDIDAGNAVGGKASSRWSSARRARPVRGRRDRPGFGGLFDLKPARFTGPGTRVAATDGVGTKLKVGHRSGTSTVQHRPSTSSRCA
jgi:hypothetical protein